MNQWLQGWVPQSVFSLENGVSSVEAQFSTALDIEEVVSQAGGGQLHVMVIKTCDTVDRSILDCALFGWGYLLGSGRSISIIIIRLG